MAIPIYKGVFDSTKSYPELSIVQDSNTQNAIMYISTKSVPSGSSLFDPTYWVKYNKSCGLTEGEVEEMITSYCGDLEDLSTEDKSSLVNAINELDDEHEALSETVSDMSELIGDSALTTEDPTITGGLNEVVISVDGINDRVTELEENPYELPIASSTALGGVKIGQNLSIESDGTLNASGGTVEQVQVDWDEDDDTSVSFIKNKPTIPDPTPIATTESVGTVKPDGTTVVINGQGTISATAPPQEQADWNETDSDSVSFIQNKPTIPQPYSLPIASANTLGGIKVGNNLSIASDGTLNATGGGGGGGADWNAVEGEDGFIENKPFDVGSTIIVKDSFDIEQDEENLYRGEDYGNIWITSDDIGKDVSFTYNGETYNSTVIEMMETPTVLINFDAEEFEPTSYPSFAFLFYNMDGMVATNIRAYLDPDGELPTSIQITDFSLVTNTKLSAAKISLGNGLKNSNGNIAINDSIISALNKLTPVRTSVELDASDEGQSLEGNVTIIGDMFNIEFETNRTSIDDVTFTCNTELDVDVDLPGGVPNNIYYKDDNLEYTVKAYIDGNRLWCNVHIIKSTVSSAYFYTPMMSSYNW